MSNWGLQSICLKQGWQPRGSRCRQAKRIGHQELQDTETGQMNVLKRTFKDLNPEWTNPLLAIPVSAWATAQVKRSWGPERCRLNKSQPVCHGYQQHIHTLFPLKQERLRQIGMSLKQGHQGGQGTGALALWEEADRDSLFIPENRGVNRNLPIPTTKPLRRKSQAL